MRWNLAIPSASTITLYIWKYLIIITTKKIESVRFNPNIEFFQLIKWPNINFIVKH